MRTLFALAIATAVSIGQYAPTHELAPKPPSDGPYTRMAQYALSPKCATPYGICFIYPQPVGAPCYCVFPGGVAYGQVIP